MRSRDASSHATRKGIEVADAVVARGKKARGRVPALPWSRGQGGVGPGKRTARTGPGRFQGAFALHAREEGRRPGHPRAEADGAMGMNVHGTRWRSAGSAPLAGPGEEHGVEGRGPSSRTCDGRFQVDADSFGSTRYSTSWGIIDLRGGENHRLPRGRGHPGRDPGRLCREGRQGRVSHRLIGASRVECKGDLVTQQGVVGKEKAFHPRRRDGRGQVPRGMRAGCGWPVRVRTSVLNSTVHTVPDWTWATAGSSSAGSSRRRTGCPRRRSGPSGVRDGDPLWARLHGGAEAGVDPDRNIALAGKLREVEGRMKTGGRVREVLPASATPASRPRSTSSTKRAAPGDQSGTATSGPRWPCVGSSSRHLRRDLPRVPLMSPARGRSVTFRLDKASGKIAEEAWEKRKGA